MEELKRFHWADYLVFGGFIVVMLGIGIFYGIVGRKNQTTANFLMANRDMKIIPVALSILSAFLSAILILGTPAEVYTKGTMYWMYMFGMSGAVALATAMFVPLLYPLRLTSSYEYLERRFNSKASKLTGTVILIIMQLLYMGVCLFSPATALEAVTGFPVWASIVIGGVVSMIYTALGGMKASVWTSAVQSGIMAAGVLAVVIKGSIDVGGIVKVWEHNSRSGRLEFLDFDPDPLKRHTFWSLIIGGTIGWLSTYGVNQASVQRFSSLPTLNAARITVLLNIPGLLFFVTICVLSGMVIFAYYDMIGCDPLASGQITNANQLIPYFVMDRLGIPGIPGIFLACLFSGSLSTMSSSLSALAAVTWEDMMKWKLGHLSDTVQTIITKVLVLVYGVAGIGMAFMAQNLGGTVLQASLSFTGAAGGPLLGLFILGGMFPCANWLGSVIGGVLGLAFPLWISSGAYVTKAHYPDKDTNTSMCSHNFTLANITANPPRYPEDITGIERLYLVSYLWYPAIGAATVVFVGLIVSCLTGCSDPEDVEPKYNLPFFNNVFCCLPNKTLRIMRCKIDLYKGNKDADVAPYDDDVEKMNGLGLPTIEKPMGIDNEALEIDSQVPHNEGLRERVKEKEAEANVYSAPYDSDLQSTPL